MGTISGDGRGKSTTFKASGRTISRGRHSHHLSASSCLFKALLTRSLASITPEQRFHRSSSIPKTPSAADRHPRYGLPTLYLISFTLLRYLHNAQSFHAH